MPSNPVPTLGSKGWVYDPESKADYLLSCYFTSQFSQSNLYKGNISSLQYQLQAWGNNENALRNQLSSAVEAYLKGNFDSVSALVTVIDPTSVTDGRMTVQLNVMVTQAGQTYSLGRLVSFLNSKIISIMNMNDGTSNALAT